MKVDMAGIYYSVYWNFGAGHISRANNSTDFINDFHRLLVPCSPLSDLIYES